MPLSSMCDEYDALDGGHVIVETVRTSPSNQDFEDDHLDALSASYRSRPPEPSNLQGLWTHYASASAPDGVAQIETTKNGANESVIQWQRRHVREMRSLWAAYAPD